LFPVSSGLDRQLARGAARSNLQAAVVCAEDAANGMQSPHFLHGEADLAALRVDTPDPVWERDFGRAGGDVVDRGCHVVLLLIEMIVMRSWGTPGASLLECTGSRSQAPGKSGEAMVTVLLSSKVRSRSAG
jgi:hypothetical protein